MTIWALGSALFYSSQYSIRFEISIPSMEHEDNQNLHQIEERSTGISNKMFQAGDDCF
ncbi:DUF3885 domain-containing protein [Metabacillus idriensis]|uniref:DUF3885 domain-containing protein n=1 Tax=Metabacillus idriensis TaxID=324768 RepID=UPI003D816CDA